MSRNVMMSAPIFSALRLLSLTSLMAAVVMAFALSGPALAQQKKAAKPKSQVEDVPGNFVQLDVIWVPVGNPGDQPVYRGIFLRLFLSETERYEGCVKVAYVPEMVIIALADKPLTKKEFSDPKTLKTLIESIIMKNTDRRLYRQIEVSTQDMPLTKEDEALTNTCK